MAALRSCWAQRPAWERRPMFLPVASARQPSYPGISMATEGSILQWSAKPMAAGLWRFCWATARVLPQCWSSELAAEFGSCEKGLEPAFLAAASNRTGSACLSRLVDSVGSDLPSDGKIYIGRRSPATTVRRVRIRRFGGLIYRPPVNLGIPSESK